MRTNRHASYFHYDRTASVTAMKVPLSLHVGSTRVYVFKNLSSTCAFFPPFFYVRLPSVLSLTLRVRKASVPNSPIDVHVTPGPTPSPRSIQAWSKAHLTNVELLLSFAVLADEPVSRARRCPPTVAAKDVLFGENSSSRPRAMLRPARLVASPRALSHWIALRFPGVGRSL